MIIAIVSGIPTHKSRTFNPARRRSKIIASEIIAENLSVGQKVCDNKRSEKRDFINSMAMVSIPVAETQSER